MPRCMTSKVRQLFDRPGVASAPWSSNSHSIGEIVEFRMESTSRARSRCQERATLSRIFDKRPLAVRLGDRSVTNQRNADEHDASRHGHTQAERLRKHERTQDDGNY